MQRHVRRAAGGGRQRQRAEGVEVGSRVPREGPDGGCEHRLRAAQQVAHVELGRLEQRLRPPARWLGAGPAAAGVPDRPESAQPAEPPWGGGDGAAARLLHSGGEDCDQLAVQQRQLVQQRALWLARARDAHQVQRAALQERHQVSGGLDGPAPRRGRTGLG